MLGLYLGSFTVVYFLGLRDVVRAVVERHNRIEGRAQKAVHLKHELHKIQEDLTVHMKRARLEANDVFLSLRTKAAKEQKNILNEAREKTAAEIKSVRANVQEQTAREMKKLEGEIPQLARMILDQIMNGSSSVSRSKQSELRS